MKPDRLSRGLRGEATKVSLDADSLWQFISRVEDVHNDIRVIMQRSPLDRKNVLPHCLRSGGPLTQVELISLTIEYLQDAGRGEFFELLRKVKAAVPPPAGDPARKENAGPAGAPPPAIRYLDPMSVKELAEKFGVSRNTMSRYLHHKQVRAKKMGAKWRIEEDEAPVAPSDT
jgi:excisionase family DNA binding protein